MTIKKRLYITNALMVVLPVLFSTFALRIIIALFIDTANMPYAIANGDTPRLLYLLILIFAIMVFANIVLTRFIIQSIMKPINTLASGVQEIRDGNLTCRIDYTSRDEFAPICNDFNEMAEHLQILVEQRQKDERNRRELLAGISHDLRSPLTSIKAYLEGLEKGVATTPEKQQKYFNTIKTKADDLEYIINQLFMFSKLDMGDFPFRLEYIDIGKELTAIVYEDAEVYQRKGLTVSIDENTNHLCSKIDIVQFRNVIHNILGNSLKYKKNDIVHSEISCRDTGDYILISIIDNGPGVPYDQLDNLFTVFYRTDSARKNPNSGSGLGLAISSKIIERFGGKIGAEIAESGGLKINITLPKSERSL